MLQRKRLMGLFDFFSRRKKSAEEREIEELMGSVDSPREAYYAFPHIVLRQFAFERPGECLALLSDPEHTQDFLQHMVSFVNEHAAEQGGEPLDLEQVAVHRMRDDERACLIVELPPPQAPTECHFVGLIFQISEDVKLSEMTEKDLRYMTLEQGVSLETGGDRTVLCGWTKDSHVNYGDGPEATVEAFAGAIMD